MDKSVFLDIWETIKDDVSEKKKSEIARDLLVMLEEAGHLTYDDLMDIKEHDDYMKAAVEFIYKDEESDGYFDDDLLDSDDFEE